MTARCKRSARPLRGAAATVALALITAGCSSFSADTTGSIGKGTAQGDTDWRRDADSLAERHRANPRDADVAMAYAKSLRALGQRTQAVAVLEQASLTSPFNKALLADYGRALIDVGQYKKALDVLERAHTPDDPNWRVLSAQGTALDQLGRHGDAQRYYASALKIVPDEPSVLSNLGLSYALAKDLPRAEEMLRRAVASSKADPRVRQNLALVVGLQGRFEEAESIARADLPPEEAASNVAYLKQMLSDAKAGKKLRTAAPAT